MPIERFGFYHGESIDDVLNGVFVSQITEVNALRSSSFYHWDVRHLSSVGLIDLIPLKEALNIARSQGRTVMLGLATNDLLNINDVIEQEILFVALDELNDEGYFDDVVEWFSFDEPGTSAPVIAIFNAVTLRLNTSYPDVKVHAILKAYDLASYTTMLANVQSISMDFYATIPPFFFYNETTAEADYHTYFNQLLALEYDGLEVMLILQGAVLTTTSVADTPANILQILALNTFIARFAQHPRVRALLCFLYDDTTFADIRYSYKQLSDEDGANYSSTITQQITGFGRPTVTPGGFGGTFLGNMFLGFEYTTAIGSGNKYKPYSYTKTLFKPVSSYQEIS